MLCKVCKTLIVFVEGEGGGAAEESRNKQDDAFLWIDANLFQVNSI